MKRIALGAALFIAWSYTFAEGPAQYTREGCWYYCDIGNVVTASEDIVLYASPPWRTQNPQTVGNVRKGEKVAVLKAETNGSGARLKVNEAKHGFLPTDDVWVLAYTGEGTYAIRHNGQMREDVELGFRPDNPCGDDPWCEMIGRPSEVVWSYVETSTKGRGWTNSRKLQSSKW